MILASLTFTQDVNAFAFKNEMFYDHHVQVSMLNKGFGDVGDSKGASTGTTGSQFLEQYKTAQALAQLAAQHSQTGPPNTSPSWDTSGASLGQYGELSLLME